MTFEIALLPDNRAQITGPYSPALSKVCREIPGMRSDRSGPVDAVAIVTEEMRGMGMDIPTLDHTIAPPVEDSRLRPYQASGVAYLLDERRCLLGDEMGLGKTAQAIIAAARAGGRLLVICPNYVRGVWSNARDGGELVKWGHPGAANVMLPTSRTPSAIPDDVQVVVIHYDILHAWRDALAAWGARVAIIDEAHALQNETSQRSVGARTATASCAYVWALTGTPLTNRPRDLYNIVETIRPGTFGGNFFAYGLRYCDAHKEAVTPTRTIWKFDGQSHLDELRDRLAWFLLRRTKADVALELPPKTRSILRVPIPPTRYVSGAATKKELRSALDAAADAKIEFSSSAVADALASGARVVVFTYRRSVAEFLAARHDGHLIHGGVPMDRRESILQGARATGKLLVATIDSTGVGIDLSYADMAIFVELSYEPYKLLQAESRLHRFGAKRPVFVQYVIAAGSADEIIASRVVSKLDTFSTVIGDTGDTLHSDLDGVEADILAELGAAIESQKTAPKRAKRAKEKS